MIPQEAPLSSSNTAGERRNILARVDWLAQDQPPISHICWLRYVMVVEKENYSM
jgi:hypothetical protein